MERLIRSDEQLALETCIYLLFPIPQEMAILCYFWDLAPVVIGMQIAYSYGLLNTGTSYLVI